MTTELHNAIMKRSRYRNKFLKDKSQTRRENYTIQRNLSKKLLRKTKISYFENLNTKIITDYCNYFPQKNIHSLSTIIETFEKHPSILNIKKMKLDSVFSFRKTTQEEVLKVIQDLNTKKSCQTSDTPTKIIKLNSDIFSNLIHKHFNYCIDKGEFSNDLKHADIVPICKKNNKCEKNYRPVSILSNLSKVYEKLMYNQLYEYFDKILFPSQCGFQKGYRAQQCYDQNI